MYRGWIGTPKILHQFVFSDGEASYNRTLDEMFIISGLGVLVAYVAFRIINTHRKRKRG